MNEPKMSEEAALQIRELKRYLVGSCIKIVEITMAREMKTMSSRIPSEQNTIGSLITVIESDLKNEMKLLIE